MLRMSTTFIRVSDDALKGSEVYVPSWAHLHYASAPGGSGIYAKKSRLEKSGSF